MAAPLLQNTTKLRPSNAAALPDSVFSFAAELVNAGWAFEYLRRRYSGDDPRLEALLS